MISNYKIPIQNVKTEFSKSFSVPLLYSIIMPTLLSLSLSLSLCQKLKQLINFTTNALFQIIQFQSKMLKTEFSKSVSVPLLCTIIMLNLETLKTFTKLETRQFESDSKECTQIWKNNERFWRREERESDLRLFVDGGDEIREEIEAEESVRRLLGGGGDYGLQLRNQHAEPRERHVLSHVLLRHFYNDEDEMLKRETE